MSNVLLFEFSGIDSEGSLADLIQPGHRVTRVDPLAAHMHQSPTLQEQADAIEIQDSAYVLATCSGAALAARVAHRTGAHLVLLNPYHVTAQRVGEEFGNLFGKLGGDPSGVTDSFAEALMTRRESLVEACGGAAAAEFADYLLLRYRAWLRFLAACAQAGLVAQAGPISVLGTEHTLTGLVNAPDVRLSEVDRSIVRPPSDRPDH